MRKYVKINQVQKNLLLKFDLKKKITIFLIWYICFGIKFVFERIKNIIHIIHNILCASRN